MEARLHTAEDEVELWDAVIVGGGPAGLSAALVLGRCRRRVLLFDAGHPRNERSKAMHGYLSRDGISPAEFLQTSREQLRKYTTVHFVPYPVVEVERGNGRFTVIQEGGKVFHTRTILLATGLVDVLPQIGGFQQFWGTSIHTCPYCDGWEHRDQTLAVLGNDSAAVDLAIELLLWSKQVTLLTNGPLDLGDKCHAACARNGVTVEQRQIRRFAGEGDELRSVEFTDGAQWACNAVFFSPRQHQRSAFAEKLGCKFCESDGCIQSGEFAETCVPGVYAAGNATRGVQLVIAAAAEGMHAAFAINNALLEADSASGRLRETTPAIS